MLGAIEFPRGKSIDKREHSIGKVYRGAWIVLGDVLNARLEVGAGLRA